ncbi:protein phosphatase 1 regulatory subunit 7 [Haematococcus lacustris]|uniref:Protein phosphatase 1 regulatory subunit 7 n=1 Tax=Haematococcus lacustris TaxID=44745 RepID=A0A699ZCL6_HAELA|nr:protein phosphatase 1 regulatory subunit 7 [Haematococcus lacustris]
MQPLLRLDSKCRHEAEDIKAAASRFDLEIVFSLTMPGRGLTSITSLAPCINLTDLSLPDNKIAKLEGLEPLTQLRRLNLARNQISKLEGLWHLNHLECLRLEGNRLEQVTSLSLKQLAELPALRILYLQLLQPLLQAAWLQGCSAEGPANAAEPGWCEVGPRAWGHLSRIH